MNRRNHDPLVDIFKELMTMECQVCRDADSAGIFHGLRMCAACAKKADEDAQADEVYDSRREP